MKKRVINIILIAVMVLTMTACGSTSNETDETEKETTQTEKQDDIEIGTVIVGTDATYPPFCYMDDESGELTGFEIEMVREIAKRANLDVDIQAVQWEGCFGLIDSGKIDTYMCCIFPNEERQEKYIFSREYIYDENRFITLEGNGSKYKTYEDLAGKKIGCAGGGNTFDTLSELEEQIGFEIVAYNGEAFVNDLALGRLDLIYKSPVSAFVQQEALGVKFELAECPTLESASCALPWRKDDPRSAKICEIFSETIQEMIDDGTMKQLSEEWLEMDLSVYDPLFDF